MKQPAKGNSPKAVVHKINNKIRNILKKPLGRSPFSTKTSDIKPTALLEMSPHPHGNYPSIPNKE